MVKKLVAEYGPPKEELFQDGTSYYPLAIIWDEEPYLLAQSGAEYVAIHWGNLQPKVWSKRPLAEWVNDPDITVYLFDNMTELSEWLKTGGPLF